MKTNWRCGRLGALIAGLALARDVGGVPHHAAAGAL
jgi:hypothetical protein